jgi:Cu+-exporting ATPase
VEEASPLSNESNVIVLSVEGMSCAVCTGRVERGLLQVPGVTTAFVSLATHRAEVGYSSDCKADSLALDCQEAVRKSGYPCQILSSGNSSPMTLQDNAKTLENAKHSELKSWRNLLCLSLVLLFPMLYIQRDMMHMMKDQEQSHHLPTSSSTSGDDGMDPSSIMHNNYHLSTPMGRYMLYTAVLSTLIQFFVGHRYYKAAWKAGTDFGMDFLVVLGTTASYVYSIFVWMWLLVESHTQVAPDNTQLEPTFETGAMLLTFVTFGKFLEAYAKGKTSSALEALMRLQPQWASRVVSGMEGFVEYVSDNDDDDGKNETESQGPNNTSINLSALETEEISSWDVQIGDYLKVLPGARIPADGVIVALSSRGNDTSSPKSASDCTGQQRAVAYIDESAFSGEPFPVPKSIGDSVYGSSVNQLTVLVIRVTATGSNSVLAKIVRLMEDAQRHKAPIQALADRIASIFAPAVMGLAFLTFVMWLLLNYEAETTGERFFLAFLSAISVIVVACPCALG